MPFSGIKIFYRELNSKEQIILSKANVMLPLEDEFLEDYGRVLMDVVLGCIKNKEDFLKLNLIEYVLFLCKLRIVSINEDIELQVKNQDEDYLEEDEINNEQKQIVKFTLNLSHFMLQLYEASKKEFENSEIKEGEVSIFLNWPSIKDEKYFLKNKGMKFALESIPLFIERMEISNKNINFLDFDLEQKTNICDRLPAKLQNKIQEKIINCIKKFLEAKLFKGKISEYLNFNFYDLSYQNVLRLLFSDNLKNIYQEYYVLASRNISPAYIDNITIAERKVYFSFIEKEMSSQDNNISGNEAWSFKNEDMA
jgi:hypothetical protein